MSDDVPQTSPAAPIDIPAPITPPAPASSWRDSLPPEYRDHAEIKGYNDLSTLVKTHLNQQSLLGRKGIIPPTDKDGPEIWDRYYKGLGRPDAPDAYGLKRPENIPEPIYKGLVADEFAKTAHGLGLTQKQAQGLHDWWNGTIGKRLDEDKASWDKEAETANASLREKWGNAFDAKMALAERVIDHAGPEFGAVLKDSRLRNNPAFIEAFANLGDKMSEHSIIQGRPTGGVMTPAEALASIAELETEALKEGNAHPSKDPTHPGHRAWNDRRANLYKMAYPEKAA